MRKIVLLLSATLLLQWVSAQTIVPSYPQVLTAFFSRYDVQSNSNVENELIFVKKKGGWYLQQVDRVQNDKLLNEKLFWSAQDGQYKDVSSDYPTMTGGATNQKVNEYLNEGTNSWYDYERCVYFGYNGWATDIINDYEGQTLNNDTLYESLARAYSHTALSYFWYQAGGSRTDNDPLKRPLGRVECPSKERIEKVKYYIDRALQTYALLEKRNPLYQTRVGNIRLKRQNEVMYGFNQMMMAGDMVAAKQYVQALDADDNFINMAKNYLNACPTNSILFTFGDNDTYPLWYVQQKLGFRKDVTVINNSLLGLPSYIKALRDSKEVAISIPDAFLAETGNDYYLYNENKKAPKEITVKSLVAAIVAKKEVTKTSGMYGHSVNLSNYSTQKIIFPATGNAFAPFIKKGFAMQPFSISLRRFFFLNDLLTFDIIANSIATRPICFSSGSTSYFDKYLVTEGMVKRLLPLTATAKQKYTEAEIKSIEQYLDKSYQPLVGKTDGSNAYADGQEFQHASSFGDVIQYYSAKKDYTKEDKWLKRSDDVYPNFDTVAGATGLNWGLMLIKAGSKERGVKVLERYAQRYFDFYKSPSAVNQLVSKADCLDMLKYINESIQGAYIFDNGQSTLVESLLQQLKK